MIAYLAICRHGPLLKIVSKIYYHILVKNSGWTKYDLTTAGELTICLYGPRLIIVSNSYYVLSASKLVQMRLQYGGPFNHSLYSMGQF